jgi:tetratricopeptide (TPR) repeat protein
LAQHTCEKLRNRQWDKLGPRQRFRTLSILGAASLSLGQFADAARLFIEAKDFQTDDPTALANEARAYHFLGRKEHAFRLAARAKERFPSSSLVLTVWLDVAPASASLKDLLDAVPPHLTDDAEVATILARRALVLHEDARAEALARSAIKSKPDWSYPWAVLGETIFRSALPDASVDYGRMAALASRPRLLEAEEACTKAIDLAKTERQVSSQAGTLLVRAEVRRGLGDEPAGDEDVIAAFSQDPEDPTVVREYARLKLRRGETEDAARILRSAVQKDTRADLTLLLALAMSGRGTADARREALPLYEGLLADPAATDVAFRMHVIESALADLAKDQLWDKGRSLLAQLPPRSASEAAVAAFQARLELTAGDREKASQLASRAKDALADDASHDDLRLIAVLLADLGRDRDAFPLWRRLEHHLRIRASTQAD